MLQETATYSVVLLPGREVAARHLSLHEAEAWIRTYNGILHGKPFTATVVEEPLAVEKDERQAA
jgi:hypothetical protein